MFSNNNIGLAVSGNSYLHSVFSVFSDRIKIGHLNCRSMRPFFRSTKFNEISSLLENGNFNLFGVSETWLDSAVSNQAVQIPGYVLCRNVRHTRGGGIGIFIPNGLKFKSVFRSSIPSQCESLFIELFFW